MTTTKQEWKGGVPGYMCGAAYVAYKVGMQVQHVTLCRLLPGHTGKHRFGLLQWDAGPPIPQEAEKLDAALEDQSE